jgi:DNA polymerase III delta prime subunit
MLSVSNNTQNPTVKILKKLWVEEYRPKNLAEVIFANCKERSTFQAMVDQGSLPNLLIIGHQGTGKTSISGALLNEFKVLRADVLRINCSDEKIDAMRDKVKTFAYTMPMGAFKVVQLEEIDFLGMDAQALLRSLIEEVSSSCRFIATANYSNKILPAIRSRFQEFTFSSPERDEILLRMADILEGESIQFDVDDLDKVISAAYPDVRKTLQLLEQSSKTGVLIIAGSETVDDWKLQLLPLLENGDLKAARSLVCTSASREELQDVYRFLYENIHRVKNFSNKEDQAIVLIAQYAYQHMFVADVEIQIAALFIELGAL